VPLLVAHFLAERGRPAPTAEVMARFMEYDWPGNVRELKNALESAAILATGETVGLEGFAELGSSGGRPGLSPQAGAPLVHGATAGGALALQVGATLAEVERELILATLRRHPQKREAARVLGIGLRTLYTKLALYQRPGGGRHPADPA
jgi:DNA-binding NtrC family response regulator